MRGSIKVKKQKTVAGYVRKAGPQITVEIQKGSEEMDMFSSVATKALKNSPFRIDKNFEAAPSKGVGT